MCKKTGKVWIPNTECGERCKMNPPEKNTVAFCTNEKCFCYKQYIIPGIFYRDNSTKASDVAKVKGNSCVAHLMILIVIKWIL